MFYFYVRYSLKDGRLFKDSTSDLPKGSKKIDCYKLLNISGINKNIIICRTTTEKNITKNLQSGLQVHCICIVITKK